MRIWYWLISVVICLPVMFIGACAEVPPPRVVFEDPITAIRLQVDTRASAEHSHPAEVTAGQMVAVLKGVTVVSRRGGLIANIVTGAAQGEPAFLADEIFALAPALSQALSMARPNELVTFYRRFSDANTALAVTSGGLFVQDQYLYFILANNRNSPLDAININYVYDYDPINDPLQPITRNSFRASFDPGFVLVRDEDRRPWPYVDPGRVVVIDLTLLAKDSESHAPPPSH